MIPWLLHLANTDPGPSPCESFYVFKEAILRKRGTFDGHDMQEIEKECWGSYYQDYCHGKGCRKCGGTGIYDRFWVRLERWKYGRYTFHIPAGRTWKKPDSVQIKGYVEHKNYGIAANEAKLWLYLLFGQFGMIWREMKSHAYCHNRWWPFSNVHRLLFEISLRWPKRRKCWCGSRFWNVGMKNWQVCKKCRGKPRVVKSTDIPF